MAAVLILQLQPGLLNLTMRRTDVFVHEQLRLTPLSVSADRIAHVAFRCAVLLAKLDAADAPVDRSGSGPVAEVYPAALAADPDLPALQVKVAAGGVVRVAADPGPARPGGCRSR